MADNVIPFPGAEAEPDDAPPFSQADIQAITQQLIDELGSPEAVLQALGAFGGFEPFGGRGPFDLMSPRPKPKLLRKRSKRATYVVRLDLDDAKPPIWRRLRLRSDVTLGHLHGIIQVAMGWTNSHLHQFKMGPSTKDFMMMPFLTAYDLSEGETDGIPENDVRLDQVLGEPGHRLFYEYDFGDSWHHTIKLERVEPWVDGQPDASCVTGRRACPPEDVGGVPGYEDALAGLRGEPSDNPEWTRELLAWLPPRYDPEHFDVAEINEQLEQGLFNPDAWHPGIVQLLAQGGAQLSPIAALVSRATRVRVELTDAELDATTHRYRHLLTLIGDGLKLTQAGYLPPALVKQLADDLELIDSTWPFPASTEVNTTPVLSLRESAVSLGLLRKQHGKLLPMASAKRMVDDPRKLFAHIRGRLPLGRHESDRDAGLLALLFTAAGQEFYAARHEAAGVYGSLGWTSPVSLERALWHQAQDSLCVLSHLAPGARDATRIAGALLAR